MFSYDYIVLCGFFTVIAGDFSASSPPVESNDKHKWTDRTTNYCWHHCMCKLNNACASPDVYSNCACDPDQPIRTTSSPLATLPLWCYSPDGSTCSWYHQCLEKRHPCQGTEASYAITYAQKFCELYSDHYASFSSNGQKWIDAVRKCLQVELVPILRPWIHMTCAEIKTLAFKSHTNCYTSPAAGISFCSLGLLDRLRIFWTIKGAFVDAFISTMKGLLDTLFECHKINSESVDVDDNNSVLTRVFVKKLVGMEDNPDVYSSKIIDAIAFREHWADKGLAWFGYHDATNIRKKIAVVEESRFRVDIVLVSKQSFDLNAPNALKVNIKEMVLSLADSVKRGSLEIKVDGINVDVVSMTACVDITCNSNFVEVTARSAGTMTKLSGTLLIVLGIVDVLCYYMIYTG